MTRTQVQFPDPLYEQLKKTAEQRDVSLAELLRRAAEAYLQTLPDQIDDSSDQWEMPVLRGSGGYLTDPVTIRVEADAISEKGTL